MYRFKRLPLWMGFKPIFKFGTFSAIFTLYKGHFMILVIFLFLQLITHNLATMGAVAGDSDNFWIF